MELIKNTGIHYDTSELLAELDRNKDFWNLYTGRQKNIKFHKETKNIPLRTWDVKPGEIQRDCMRSRELPYFYDQFPVTFEFLKVMEEKLDSILACATYVYLPVGKSVYPHTDGGRFYEVHDRYHFVLQGMYNMTVEEESDILVPGSVYWFDNTKMHSVDNISPADRIALIFDMIKIPKGP